MEETHSERIERVTKMKRKLVLIAGLVFVLTGLLYGIAGRQRYEIRPRMNLIAHYKMNDTAASAVVVDSLGNHNGVFHGTGGADDFTSAHSVAGKINRALQFGEDKDIITVLDHVNLSFGDGSTDSPFSISCWVRKEAEGMTNFVNKYESPNPLEYELFANDSQLIFLCSDSSVTKHIGRAHNIILPLDVWYHIVGTYDGSGASSGIRIYLNGVRVDDEDYETSGYTAMHNTASALEIGGETFAKGGCSIDNVMIFNIELTSSEVKRLYNNGHGTESLQPARYRTRYRF